MTINKRKRKPLTERERKLAYMDLPVVYRDEQARGLHDLSDRKLGKTQPGASGPDVDNLDQGLV